MPELTLYDHQSSICSQMARLALVEKGLNFQRRQIDIMDTNEQFEPWYMALNPRAVVPTLQIDDEIVTDTLRIVNRAQLMPGPDLSGDETTQDWLKDIMSLHYGVLLYRNRLEPDGTAPQIIARGQFLEQLAKDRADIAETTRTRLEGNRRFQALLQNPDDIEKHLNATRALVDRMISALRSQPYLAGGNLFAGRLFCHRSSRPVYHSQSWRLVGRYTLGWLLCSDENAPQFCCCRCCRDRY